MQYNHKILLVFIVIVPAAVYGAFSMPPLTTGGGGGLAGVTREEYDQAVIEEYDFCRRTVSDTNCECYAHRSGIVMAYRATQVPGLTYADRQQLARDQAAQAC